MRDRVRTYQVADCAKHADCAEHDKGEEGARERQWISIGTRPAGLICTHTCTVGEL